MHLGSIGVIVAARTSSSRLPGKALLPLGGMPMVLFLLSRLRTLQGATLAFATTTLSSDDQLADIVSKFGIPVYRGNADDVVERYVSAAQLFDLDTVVRITADCPFVNAELVENCLSQARTFSNFDLATTKGRLPVGLDAEIYPAFRMQSLHDAGTLTPEEREHLTLHMYRHPNFVLAHLEPKPTWPRTDRHFTIDTPADYDAAQALVGKLGSACFPIAELLAITER